MKLRNIFPTTVFLVVLATADGSDKHRSYRFNTFDVPPELGSYTSAYGINNAGIVVGNFMAIDGSFAGFVFRHGEFTEVAVPDASTDDLGQINAVNDIGQSAGSFIAADTGIFHAFLRGRGGEITVLPDPAPDAFFTEATGINNPGTVTGLFADARGFHGFILRSGVYTIYDYPGAVATVLG